MLGLIAFLLAAILFVLAGGAGYYFWEKSQREAIGKRNADKMRESNKRKEAEIEAMEKKLKERQPD
jgi:hypothetical protein